KPSSCLPLPTETSVDSIPPAHPPPSFTRITMRGEAASLHFIYNVFSVETGS
ncbi:hypothetical protein ABG768_007886, partial [Culter alburnus]